jgi:DNA-binding transcriptional ArsR family regulator
LSGGFEQSGGKDDERTRVLAKAMAHPLRGRLLQAVSEKSEAGVSIRQLAARLAEPKRRIRYHLDWLEASGLVEIAREESAGSVVERFYRVNRLPLIEHELHDRDQARSVAVEALKALLADASGAIKAKLFGARSGHAVIRVPADVDKQGWEELSALQRKVLPETQTVFEDSRKRLEASGEKPVGVVVAILLFEVPPWHTL